VILDRIADKVDRAASQLAGHFEPSARNSEAAELAEIMAGAVQELEEALADLRAVARVVAVMEEGA
jgi:hypothetical protein